MKLRPYQNDAVKTLRKYLNAGERKCALVSPTGSGKSLVVTALASACVRDGLFDRVVVAVPMVHVQDSFGDAERIRCGREVFVPGELGWEKVSGSGSVKTLREVLRSKVDGPTATVVTHQSLSSLTPTRTARALLVIDEGHHTTEAEGASDLNKISAVRDAWLKGGGSVLLVTATPYRHDRSPVVDDSWCRVERTIIDHIADPSGPYAPAKLECRTSLIKGFAPKSRAALYDSSRSGVRARRKFTDQVAARWDADGYHKSRGHEAMGERKVRPRALFIVPAYASKSWVSELVKSFARLAGVDRSRILDATGTAEKDKHRTRGALAAERALGSRAWIDGAFDVVIACKRFDEATDWPVCSHVYVIGYASSIPLTLQRWGRALRSKESIAAHPFGDAATLTFMLPEWSGELAKDADEGDQLSRYRDDAHLLACCLHDYTTGLEFAREGAQLRRRALGKDSRLAQSFELSAPARAVALRDVDRAQAKAEGLRALVTSLAALPEARACAALSVLSERVVRRSPADRKLVQAAWAAVAREVKTAGSKMFQAKGLLRSTMLRTFRDALTATGRDTLSPADSHFTFVADFTGQDVKEVSAALARGHKVRSLEVLDAELAEFFRQTGRAPACNETTVWSAWSTWLTRRGSTLRTECIRLGYVKIRTVESVKAEVLAFHSRTGSKPTLTGHWRRLDSWLRTNSATSLPRLCESMGLGALQLDGREWRTVPVFEAELAAHLADGLPFPSSNSPEWRAWARWLRKQGLSMTAYRGDGKYSPRTLDSVKASVQEHVQVHGRMPRRSDSKSWACVQTWLARTPGMSLHQLGVQMGLVEPRFKPRTVAMFEAELAEHVAQGLPFPTARAWSSWNGWLRRQGISMQDYRK